MNRLFICIILLNLSASIHSASIHSAKKEETLRQGHLSISALLNLSEVKKAEEQACSAGRNFDGNSYLKALRMVTELEEGISPENLQTAVSVVAHNFYFHLFSQQKHFVPLVSARTPQSLSRLNDLFDLIINTHTMALNRCKSQACQEILNQKYNIQRERFLKINSLVWNGMPYEEAIELISK